MKKSHIWKISFLVTAVIYVLTASIYNNRRYNEDFVQFDNAHLQGILDYTTIRRHGSLIKIKGMQEEFVFYPIVNRYLNDGKTFDSLAEPGDSIIKKSHSDKLKLVKGDKVYFFAFREIEK